LISPLSLHDALPISLMSDDLHSAYYVLLAWLCAGLITLMGSLSNAEVAGLISKPGGQYVYFREMYGDLFAFLFGWASFSVIQTRSEEHTSELQSREN